MSFEISSSATDALLEAGIRAAWRQWAAIGASASGRINDEIIVDPEALVLFSLTAQRHESRLESVMRGWLQVNAQLVSVQRVGNLYTQFPASSASGLRVLAEHVRAEAKDARWRSLRDSDEHGEESTRHARAKRSAPAPLLRPSALVLRMRAGFGVGVKADLISVLLASNAQPATVAQLSSNLGYTKAAVRRSLSELVAGGFADEVKGRPARYQLPRAEWAALLGLDDSPQWYDWVSVFRTICAVDEARRDAKDRGLGSYATFSLLRDNLEDVPAFSTSMLSRPVRAFREAADFERFLEELTAWLDGNFDR